MSKVSSEEEKEKEYVLLHGEVVVKDEIGSIEKFYFDYYEVIWGVIKVSLFYALSTVYWVHHYKDFGWDVSAAIYFITASVTTVGYGDYYPLDDVGRRYALIWMIVGVAVIGGIFNQFADYLMSTVGKGKGKEEKDQVKITKDNNGNVEEVSSTPTPTTTLTLTPTPETDEDILNAKIDKLKEQNKKLLEATA